MSNSLVTVSLARYHYSSYPVWFAAAFPGVDSDTVLTVCGCLWQARSRSLSSSFLSFHLLWIVFVPPQINRGRGPIYLQRCTFWLYFSLVPASGIIHRVILPFTFISEEGYWQEFIKKKRDAGNGICSYSFLLCVIWT